ncbi:MAG TPA: hypothetical protein VNI58_03415, partial [Mariprofundaceae bacterium]|nr:hypothetical protein [Mariprofundaceae bacterium]
MRYFPDGCPEILRKAICLSRRANPASVAAMPVISDAGKLRVCKAVSARTVATGGLIFAEE